MDDRLYNATIACPVCSAKIEVTKVKSKACKISSRDSDFCIHYEDLNPILYDVWVCENCGYAAQVEKFRDIGDKDAKIILDTITPKWEKRAFTGERTVDDAIEVFKLALYNAYLINSKTCEMAKICIRLAWLYRFREDEREKDFLSHALNCYMETYEKETFPADKLDEATCMYMIAELQRRIGNYEEAVRWFSRIISFPEARQNNVLMEAVRDQYYLVKERLKEQGAGS